MRKKKDTKEKILKCAKEMILTNEEDFSMRNIARKCNITQGTIYIHFQNKGELLANIMMDDWHMSLEKMDDLVQNCSSFSDGLVGIAEIIKQFAKPYQKVWDSYRTNEAYTSIKDPRHEDLVKQIEKFVEILIKRFTKTELSITKILSEVVLVCANQNIQRNELENLGKALIKEENHE